MHRRRTHTMEGGSEPDSENGWKWSPLQIKRKKLKIMRDDIVYYLIGRTHFPPLKIHLKLIRKGTPVVLRVNSISVTILFNFLCHLQCKNQKGKLLKPYHRGFMIYEKPVKRHFCI